MKKRPSWGSYPAFLMAAVGASIGLGNVWKFPYELGLHGGGTFLLVYIPCVLLVAFPLVMAELMIGRMGRGSPVHAIARIAREQRLSSTWKVIGWLGILTSFLIFSYYSVVGSWILFYIMQSFSGAFVDVPAEIVQNSYGALLNNTEQMLVLHSVFVLMVVVVLTRDVRRGLERAVRLLMPAFLGILVWLFLYTSKAGNFERAYQFIFTYDLSLINVELVISALAQSLFSMSIGIGILIMFGSYLDAKRPLFLGVGAIAVFDTSVALVMALLIFSIVFAFGLQVDSGPGLIFETLPVAFSQIETGSALLSASFFILLLATALISGFALLEPCIVWMVGQFSIPRRYAAWIVGFFAWLSGLASVYSFSDLQFSFYYFGEEKLNGAFDVLNIVTTHVLMPLTALLVALFAGWSLSKGDTQEALDVRWSFAYKLWRLCIKSVVPLILIVVLVLVLFYPE